MQHPVAFKTASLGIISGSLTNKCQFMFLLHNKLRCLNCCILCRLGYFFKTHGTITTIDVVRQKLSLPGEFTATNLAFLCFVQSVPLSWKKRLIYLLHLHLRSLIAVVSVLFSSCGDRWNQSTTLNGSQVEVESVIDVNSIFFFVACGAHSF